MRNRLRNVMDRLVGMLPAARPIFEVGKDQKLTIVMEPSSELRSEPSLEMAILLKAVDQMLSNVRTGRLITTAPIEDWNALRDARELFK